MSRRDLAKACSCCEDTIDNLTKRFNIPYTKFLGERYFDLEEFRRLVQAGTQVGRPEAPRRGRPRKVTLPEAAA